MRCYDRPLFIRTCRKNTFYTIIVSPRVNFFYLYSLFKSFIGVEIQQVEIRLTNRQLTKLSYKQMEFYWLNLGVSHECINISNTDKNR